MAAPTHYVGNNYSIREKPKGVTALDAVIILYSDPLYRLLIYIRVFVSKWIQKCGLPISKQTRA
jgi:hypothetical protein